MKISELKGHEGFVTALQAMVDGLERQSKRKGFVVDMKTFGEDGGETCFGCAATCALQEMYGVNFDASNVDPRGERARALGERWQRLNRFEYDMDSARCGYLAGLAALCGINNYEGADWYLSSYNWKEQETKEVVC